MSAINAIVTPESAIMLVDGLCYNDGLVTSVDFQKSHLLRGMKAVVAATGDARTSHFFKVALEENFSTFDDIAAAGSEFFVSGFKAFADRFCNGNAVSNLVLAGWLEKEDRPAVLAADLVHGRGEWRLGSVDAETANVIAEYPIVASPAPSLAEMRAARYQVDAAPETKLWHLMEIQRRMRANDGRHYVGGQATLTTVTRRGVKQRVVRRWPEDRVGEEVRPRRMEWGQWKRAG